MEKISNKIRLKSSIIRSFVNFTILSIILIFLLLFCSIATFQIFQFAIPFQIDDFFAYFLLLSLLIGAILMSISFYYWRLNKPLKQLTEAVEIVENGQLNFQFKHTFKGELGQVCTTFENMRKTLSKKHFFAESVTQKKENTKQKVSLLKSIISSFTLYHIIAIILIAFTVSGIIMTVASSQTVIPVILSNFLIFIVFLIIFIGIGTLVGYLFYSRRIELPLSLLVKVFKKIELKELDFKIDYLIHDELGLLIQSVEKMHQSLENYYLEEDWIIKKDISNQDFIVRKSLKKFFA